MTFTASNGARVTDRFDGGVRVAKVYEDSACATGLFEYEVDALREYFQHERDEELGRWRWPEDPNLVVYPLRSDGTEVRVLNERSGATYVYDALTVSESTIFSTSIKAADAYFATHPALRPIRVQVEKLGGGWVDVIEYVPGDESQRLDAEDQVHRFSATHVTARIVEGDDDE